MTCKLMIFLKGSYYASKEVILTNDDEDLSDRENFMIRESEFKSAIEVFRIAHYRQIIKSQYEFDIVAVFKSSMKEDYMTMREFI